MKKFTAMLAIGAFALTSCSNNDLVDPAVDTKTGDPIAFAVHSGNMSRADDNLTSKLSVQHWDFGVWAFKNTDDADIVVMNNYLVGYWNGTLGYMPNNNQQFQGSDSFFYAWYYEGLGYEEAKSDWTDAEGVHHDAPYFTFMAGDSGKSAATSVNKYQYPKYWDKAIINTWFYAYAPYSMDVDYDQDKHIMTFPQLSVSNGADAMFASTKANNNNQFVNIKFYRLLSKIRFAFYETIPGYKVELIPYSSNCKIPESDQWKDYGTNAMFAVPAKKVVAESGDPSFQLGSFISQAQPVVSFSGNDFLTPYVSYKNSLPSSENISIPLLFHSVNSQSTDNTLLLGTSRDAAIVNDTKDMLPASTVPGTENDGFTLNLSLKLTALDTQETIFIKDVRVYVPAEDCQWRPNHIYTYYFKITKSVPGKVDEPLNPSFIPDTDPYIVPIIFENVTVEEFDNNAEEVDYEVS